MKFNKKNIVTWTLVVWFVLSASYISWGVSKNMSDSIFLKGYVSAVSDIMNRAEDQQCAPFPIFLEERKVDLINIQCLGPVDETMTEED